MTGIIDNTEEVIKMRITAKQIAQQLGVSASTVSLALRGKPGVSDSVRQKILDTAASLGMESCSGAHLKQMHFIQLVIFKAHGEILSDTPFFEQLTQGVADEAQAQGYRLSISYLYGGQDLNEQLESINSCTCDGIILLATEMRYADIERLKVIQHPIVVLDNFFPTSQYDCVSIDNISGASKAVKYLISMGHTRLGYLHSNVDIRNFQERHNGYLSGCRFLPERDARDAAKRIVTVGVTTEGAMKEMQKYLADDPCLPTAFFADNDRIALGCCQALQSYGYRIPEDVSIIGFDNSSLCTTLQPQLTSMNVQKQRMGALAVFRLISLINHPVPETVHISVLPQVVARGSVQRLRNSTRKDY